MNNTVNFSSLGLSESVLQAVSEQGYETPSPIQAQAIPPILAGKDIMGAAQTGTGKTAGFVLPILDLLTEGRHASSNHCRALIVTPTRELAAQIHESVTIYGRYTSLKSAMVFGGVKINPQMMKLRKGTDILVATPGRLLDLHNQNAIKFNQLEVLVLDEADRMLDMGFIHDIKKIIRLLPKQRQSLLFSATFSEEIRKLARGLVNNAVEVSVTPANSTVDTINHWISPVDKKRKAELLVHLIRDRNWARVLVFSRTKHGANKLCKKLNSNKIDATAIHGNKSQGARTRALAEFKSGKIQVLVATDIAARGLDISQLPQVVNFDLPNVPEDYVHRIGRTGRAGAKGEAISLVSADEINQLQDIEKLIGRHLLRKTEDGFEPDHSLPNSKPLPKKNRTRKPRKHKNPGFPSVSAHAKSKPKKQKVRRKRNPDSPWKSKSRRVSNQSQ